MVIGEAVWSLVRSTGRPAQWALVGFLLAGLAVGLGVGLAVAPRGIALLPGLTAGTVAAVGSFGPPRLALPVARWVAVTTVVVVSGGFLVSGRPWLAALGMAAVAVFTSAAAGVGPVGMVIGVLTTLAYVLAMVISTETAAHQMASLTEVAVRVALAAVAGLLVAMTGSALRFGSRPAGSRVAPLAPPWRPVWHSARSFDEHARDGVRRAVPLALCVLWYEWTQAHDVLWVLVTALAVLLPTGKNSVDLALARVVATVLGVVVLGLIAGLLPVGALVVIAVVAMVLGLAYQPVFPVIAGAASAFAVVVFVGSPTGDVTSTATHRLLDTLLGVGIALAATFLLWPRDTPDGAATDTA